MAEHNGELLTPENTLVHLMTPMCWSYVEVETQNGVEDVLLQDDVIMTMIRHNFHLQAHGHPSEIFKRRYLNQALEDLNNELATLGLEL